MKALKRLLPLLLALVTVFSLAACGGDTEKETSTAPAEDSSLPEESSSVAEETSSLPEESSSSSQGDPEIPTVPFSYEEDDSEGVATITGFADGYTIPKKTKLVMTIPEVSPNGNTVTKIAPKAFEGQTRINTVIVPDTVVEIGLGAFEGCTGMEYMTLPFIGRSANPEEERFFSYIFGAAQHTDYDKQPQDIETITVTGTAPVASYAFAGSYVRGIVLAAGTPSIGISAFSGCDYLKTVSIGDGMSAIGNNAFFGAMSLAEINLPDSISSIGNNAFEGCTSLTSIVLPKRLTQVSSALFKNCSGLKTVIIQEGTELLGNEVFFGCTKLEDVTLPSTISGFGSKVFGGNCKPAHLYYNGSADDFAEIRTAIASTDFEMEESSTKFGSNGGARSTQPVNMIWDETFYGGATNKFLRIPFAGTYTNNATYTGNVDQSVFASHSAISYTETSQLTISFLVRFDEYRTRPQVEMQFSSISATNGAGETKNVNWISLAHIDLKNAAITGCGALTDNATSMEFNEWNEVKFVVDLVEGTYKTYLNGEEYANGYVSSASGSTNQGWTNITVPANAIIICKMNKGAFYTDPNDMGVSAWDTYIDLDNIQVGGSLGEDALPLSALYFYSASAPAAGGNYWHYENKQIVVWGAAEAN